MRVFTLAILISLLGIQTSSGDLVLNFVGTTGSNVVNYEATGSVTMPTGTSVPSVINSNFGRAPTDVFGNAWDDGFDNRVGDILSDFDAALNDDLVVSISYRKNGNQFGLLGLLDLQPSILPGSDDIRVRPSSGTPITYPALVDADVVSWAGSGTFTLETGTFDSIFTTGSYSNPLLGGNFVLNVSAVPEPSSVGLLTIACTGLLVVSRRRRKR